VVVVSACQSRAWWWAIVGEVVAPKRLLGYDDVVEVPSHAKRELGRGWHLQTQLPALCWTGLCRLDAPGGELHLLVVLLGKQHYGSTERGWWGGVEHFMGWLRSGWPTRRVAYLAHIQGCPSAGQTRRLEDAEIECFSMYLPWRSLNSSATQATARVPDPPVSSTNSCPVLLNRRMNSQYNGSGFWYGFLAPHYGKGVTRRVTRISPTVGL
jgi:hypothetical protein